MKTAREDAKKSENGASVEGNYALETAKDGWRLSPAGASWFKESRTRIEEQLGIGRSRVPKKDIERYIKGLAKGSLYRKYLQTRSLKDSTIFELADMLNCSPDSSNEIITRKFQRLRSMVNLANREDVFAFLQACCEAFPQLCSEGTENKEG